MFIKELVIKTKEVHEFHSHKLLTLSRSLINNLRFMNVVLKNH